MLSTIDSRISSRYSMRSELSSCASSLVFWVPDVHNLGLLWWSSSSLTTKMSSVEVVEELWWELAALCFFRCRNMLYLIVNRRWQISHENGRSPVWVRMWRRKSAADHKCCMQNAHITCFWWKKSLTEWEYSHEQNQNVKLVARILYKQFCFAWFPDIFLSKPLPNILQILSYYSITLNSLTVTIQTIYMPEIFK